VPKPLPLHTKLEGGWLWFKAECFVGLTNDGAVAPCDVSRSEMIISPLED
jgi:hypothetical protein